MGQNNAAEFIKIGHANYLKRGDIDVVGVSCKFQDKDCLLCSNLLVVQEMR